MEKLYTILYSSRIALFAPVGQTRRGREAGHHSQRMEKRKLSLAALVILAWRMLGARTSGEDLVAQAQAVKMVTANTTAASDQAANGGHAR